MAEPEVWKTVVGWPEYQVSNMGRVRRVATGRVLRAHLAKSRGYPILVLTARGQTKTFKVHMLVALAFLGVPDGSIGQGATDFQVNHKDGDKWNNRPENLEWVHPGENTQHAYDHGLIRRPRGEAAGGAKLTDDQAAEIRRRWDAGESSQVRLSRDFGISRTQVQNIVHRRQRIPA